MREPTDAEPVTSHRRRTGFLLARVGRGAWALFEDALAPLGLRPRHLVVLMELREQGPVTQRALLDLLGFDAGTLVALLTDVEDRGLAVRRRDPQDRRRHIVEITTVGLERLGVAEQAVAGAEERLLGVLDEGERGQLASMLFRVEHARQTCNQDQRAGPAPRDRRAPQSTSIPTL